ncbi:MAG: PD40 domain-containing protein [Gemmatimonadota bacterium]|nr:MAG: PD40 domain-containing protein [Gemmatimonadota bacterium]
MSPDGRHIAYSSRRERGSSLWLVDLSEALQVGGN